MLATLAALVNYSLKEGEGPDSYNALPVIMGTSTAPVREFLIICPRQKNNLAIRKGKWVYISSQNGGGFQGTVIGEHRLGGAAAHLLTRQINSDIENGTIKSSAPPAQLYDIESDISEKVNVYNDYPEIVIELKGLLHESIEIKTSTRPQ